MTWTREAVLVSSLVQMVALTACFWYFMPPWWPRFNGRRLPWTVITNLLGLMALRQATILLGVLLPEHRTAIHFVAIVVVGNLVIVGVIWSLRRLRQFEFRQTVERRKMSDNITRLEALLKGDQL